MWAQYNLDEPNPKTIQATTRNKVDADAMDAAGRGQVEFPEVNPTGDGFTQVDISQVPPTFT